MFRLRRLLTLLPTILTIALLLTGNAQAVLLDVGPTVPQVNPSTYPDLGHGFPLWYRDTNRVPLQICTDQASGMCLTAEPNPAAPLSFPDNLGDELFWWSGDAIIDYAQQGVLTGAGQAILVQAVEAAFSTGGVVPGAQVSFARMRIRIDTPFVGTYLVTTPYKQFTFTVDAATIGDGRRAINFTEDLGLAEGGIFTGALNGSIGPFLYCTNAPIVRATGSFLGDPNVPCQVLGSTFAPPGGLPAPANYFRIQGPNGFDVSTNLFVVTGKLYTDPISTPLTVDKATYSRNALGMQYLSFATTQPLSNQVNTGLTFPDNFALTGAPSALEVAGTNIPTLTMATNNPADGKFFANSDVAVDPGTIPTTVTVTNTADTPATTTVAPLVDEVVISDASYTPATRTLSISAASGDQVTPPTLNVFFPGEALSVGTLTNGQIALTFPVSIGAKSYEIPPATISVASSIGGSDTKAVSVAIPIPAPVAVDDSTTVIANNFTFISVLGNDIGSITPSTVQVTTPDGGTAVANSDGTVTYTAPAVAGTYTFTYTVSGPGGVSNSATVTVTVNPPPPPTPAQAVTLFSNVASPQLSGTSVTFSASATGGSGSYEYQYWLKDNSGVYTLVQPFSSTTTWNWNTTGLPQGAYSIAVQAKSVGSTPPNGFDTESVANYFIIASSGVITPATAVSVSASPTSPQTAGATITFTGLASGGSGFYEYQFWLKDTTGVYTLVQPFTTIQNWLWDTTGMLPGTYTVAVQARSIGTSPGGFNVENTITFDVQ